MNLPEVTTLPAVAAPPSIGRMGSLAPIISSPSEPIVFGQEIPSTSHVVRVVKKDKPTNHTIVNLAGKTPLNPKNITIKWTSPVLSMEGEPYYYPGWLEEGSDHQSVTCTLSRFIACSKIPEKYYEAKTAKINPDFFHNRYSLMSEGKALGGRTSDKEPYYYCDGRVYPERLFYSHVIAPVYIQVVERYPEFTELQTQLSRNSIAIRNKTVSVDHTLPSSKEDATALYNDFGSPFTLEDALGFALMGFKPWSD